MTAFAEIHGELTTSAKALSILMDLIGHWSALDGAGVIMLPPISDTITLTFDDTYRDLGRELPQAVCRLAENYPNQTSGEFTITSHNGRTVAEAYRVKDGKVFRRTLDDAPERHVLVHSLPARNGPDKEVLVTERDLTRVVRRNGNHKHRR